MMELRKLECFLILFLFLFCLFPIGLMKFDINFIVSASDTGWINAESSRQAADTPAGIAWAHDDWAMDDDNQYANIRFGANGNSDYLIVHKFNFDLPTGCTVDGIEVEINRVASSNKNSYIKDRHVYIVDQNGNVQTLADDKADTVNKWPPAEAAATYGGAADDWNWNDISVANIEDDDFGFALSVDATFDREAVDADVDSIEVKIHYTGDEINPVVNITYAGNTTYDGSPWWIPPAEIGSDRANDGYFVNGSYIPENTITVKANVTDNDAVNTVTLHLYNMTANTWDNTSNMTFVANNEYAVNKSGFTSGHQYSFDVYAEDDASNSVNVTWYKNKTCDPSQLVRRSVFLNCTEDNDNFEYTPFYTWNVTKLELPKQGEVGGVDVATANESKDIWRHDQKMTSNSDSGILRRDEPGSETQYTFCGAAIWFGTDWTTASDGICINSTQIDNVYFRIWWSNNTFTGNSTYNDMGINFSNGASGFPIDKSRRFQSDDCRAKLNITEWAKSKDWIPDWRTHIILGTGKMSFSDVDYTFDSNDIYELYLIMGGSSVGAFSNESYRSYVLWNLPDNATLATMDTDSDNLNDEDELFVHYTSPFHADTDEDGVNDDVEISGGTDPNIYTNIYDSPWTHHPIPANGSTSINVQPTCNVTVTQNQSNSMDITWQSNYSDGSTWVTYQTNNSVATGTNVTWDFTGASLLITRYWWKVWADDSTENVSKIFHFTTIDNNRPNLTSPSVSHDPGVDSFTLFHFNITWDDQEGDSPANGSGYLNVNISITGGLYYNMSMNWVSGNNATGAIYTYSRQLTTSAHWNYTFWAYDDEKYNSSGPHAGPVVVAQSLSFTVATQSSGNLDFKDWTLVLTGVGLTTQENVTEDNTSSGTLWAINISNTGNVYMNFSMNWTSDPCPGVGDIKMKWNTTNTAPMHARGNYLIETDPSTTQIVTGLANESWEEIWIWLDFIGIGESSSSQETYIWSEVYNG